MRDDTLLVISTDGVEFETKTVEEIRELLRTGIADPNSLLILDVRGDSPEWLSARAFGAKPKQNNAATGP
jgi:hypothetical protein